MAGKGDKMGKKKKRGVKDKKRKKNAIKMHFFLVVTQEKNFAGDFAPLHPPKSIPTILWDGE